MALRSSQYKDKEKLLVSRNGQRKRYYKKSQHFERKSWTMWEEEEILKRFFTDMELSKTIGRSVQSIQIKRCRLIKKGR